MIHERHCLKELKTQIDTMYAICCKNNQNNFFFTYLTNAIHHKLCESCYEERKYSFKNLSEEVIVAAQGYKYQRKYNERISTMEYGRMLAHDVIAEQEDGESFRIDFEEKNYDSLDEEHKKKLQFASFFTFFLLHIPFLKKFIPKKYLQNMNQKILSPAKDYSKDFSIFFIKKDSKKVYPFLLVTYQDNEILSMTPYFSSHIDSILKRHLKKPYYAIHRRKYFTEEDQLALSEKK